MDIGSRSLPLPTPEAVLDRVKSDGTFDQFRKTCLAAIEAEPSMRAYGEQIEVMSRRYLQDHRHKWSENITKNEVRAKLKDYIIKMIANPDVGISIPLQNMVENSLEKNGPKILLPQIVETVKTLQKAQQETTATQPSSSSSSSSTVSSKPVTNTELTDTSSQEKGSGNGELGLLDLPLPISIPGLNTTSRKETGGASGEGGRGAGKKEGTTSDQGIVRSKSKSKTVASSESSSSGTAGGTSKIAGKTGPLQRTSQGKLAGVKQREKEDKSPGEEREDGREREVGGDSEIKEKVGKVGGGVKTKKTEKLEKRNTLKEESSALNAKESKDETKQTEKRNSGKDELTGIDSKEDAKIESKTKGEKDREKASKPEAKLVVEPTLLEQSSESVAAEEGDEQDVWETTEPRPTASRGGSSRRRKQSIPKRRSARLASLNEESDNEKSKTPTSENDEIESNHSTPVASGTERNKKSTIAEKTKSQIGSPKPLGMGFGQRKRLRVLDSSTDDEEGSTSTTRQPSHSEDEEKGYESEVEQQTKEEEEEEGRGIDKRRKRKRGRPRTKKHYETPETIQTNKLHTSTSKKRQKRSSEMRGEDASGSKSRSSSPTAKRVRTKSGRKQQAGEELKRSPAPLQKSPSPAVVTRYNRVVKPNRRYTSPTEDDSVSSSSSQEEEN